MIAAHRLLTDAHATEVSAAPALVRRWESAWVGEGRSEPRGPRAPQLAGGLRAKPECGRPRPEERSRVWLMRQT
jgi:hypothetical protein